ncbi:phage holin [Pseudactinotalea sp. Z1732]|uniref:phage holin n=1 Tax=Micrococcales TaxID=85006 RepID=UPI003C7D5E74
MPKATDTPLIPARVRDWLYPVALAALAVAGGYGLLSESEIALWGALVAALLGLGTATAYRPHKTVEPLQAEVAVAKGVHEARMRTR